MKVVANSFASESTPAGNRLMLRNALSCALPEVKVAYPINQNTKCSFYCIVFCGVIERYIEIGCLSALHLLSWMNQNSLHFTIKIYSYVVLLLQLWKLLEKMSFLS